MSLLNVRRSATLALVGPTTAAGVPQDSYVAARKRHERETVQRGAANRVPAHKREIAACLT
jgi:hypothetical protein